MNIQNRLRPAVLTTGRNSESNGRLHAPAAGNPAPAAQKAAFAQFERVVLGRQPQVRPNLPDAAGAGTAQKMFQDQFGIDDAAKKVGGWFKDGAKKVGGWVKDGAKKVGSWIKDAIKERMDIYGNGLRSFGYGIKNTAKFFGHKIWDGAKKAGSKIEGAAKAVGSKLKEAWNSIF